MLVKVSFSAVALLAVLFALFQPEPALRLELELAATTLTVWRGDSAVARYRVAVGRPDYPTPTGTFEIRSIEWNPWWIPPATDWAAGEAARPPGPANPMGRVKLNFKPLYFLHGTPDDASIGLAASHGCVRLLNRDAIELATMVLRVGRPDLDSLAVALLARDSTTTSAWLLDAPVTLTIRTKASPSQ